MDLGGVRGESEDKCDQNMDDSLKELIKILFLRKKIILTYSNE